MLRFTCSRYYFPYACVHLTMLHDTVHKILELKLWILCATSVNKQFVIWPRNLLQIEHHQACVFGDITLHLCPPLHCNARQPFWISPRRCDVTATRRSDWSIMGHPFAILDSLLTTPWRQSNPALSLVHRGTPGCHIGISSGRPATSEPSAALIGPPRDTPSTILGNPVTSVQPRAPIGQLRATQA